MTTTCRICGCFIDPDYDDPQDACPDCVDAEADDMLIEEVLTDVDDS